MWVDPLNASRRVCLSVFFWCVTFSVRMSRKTVNGSMEASDNVMVVTFLCLLLNSLSNSTLTEDAWAPLERRRMETYLHTNIENFKACHSKALAMGQKWACSPRCHVSFTADWSWSQSTPVTTADTIRCMNECLVYHLLLKTESQMLVGVGFMFRGLTLNSEHIMQHIYSP